MEDVGESAERKDKELTSTMGVIVANKRTMQIRNPHP
jgi:hypothetical protein